MGVGGGRVRWREGGREGGRGREGGMDVIIRKGQEQEGRERDGGTRGRREKESRRRGWMLGGREGGREDWW